MVVLGYDYREIKNFVARNPVTDIDRIFLWQGTARILIAIVKYVEDKRNVLHDTRAMGVPVLLVVEDNIRYYSSFLPVIYTELISQSRRVIQEGINVAHKLVRMQARPKILLASNFEDAAATGEGVSRLHPRRGLRRGISVGRRAQSGSGIRTGAHGAQPAPDVPIVLQSSRTEFRPRAHAEGFAFLRKRSPTLLRDLRRMLTRAVRIRRFCFPPARRHEVARANDLNELEAQLQTMPAESMMYHAQRNHFSRWLMARTEFALAPKLRPRKVSDFGDPEHLRHDLIESINDYRREQSEVLIGDFKAATFKPAETHFSADWRRFAGRQGARAGLRAAPAAQRGASRGAFPACAFRVPPAVVLATDVFDHFLAENNLLRFRDALRRRRRDPAALPGRRRCRLRCRSDLRAFLTRCAIRWRCALPACWRIRSTSRSPACTKLSCWATSRRI